MSKFKRLFVKENEMLVSVNTSFSKEPLYVKVLKGDKIYDKEGNEVGDMFFHKSPKGDNLWGYWNKEKAPKVEYVPNDKRLRKELGIE
jgi:hypothetical protein